MAAKKASAKSLKKSLNKQFRPKTPIVKEPLTKSGIIKAVMELTGVAKRDTVAVIDALGNVIELHVKNRGPGKFTLPGLLKIHVVKKAARPSRPGVNPFTGEKIILKAKAAHKVVKIRALRKLKEMVL